MPSGSGCAAVESRPISTRGGLVLARARKRQIVSACALLSCHHECNRLVEEGEVAVANAASGDKFLPRFGFARPPAAVAEIFVKDDDRSGSKSFRCRSENKRSRFIGVRIDMYEGKRLSVLSQKVRQRLVEPALDQYHVGGNLGRDTTHVECSFCGRPTFPVFPQALEGIKAIDRLACERSQKADRPALKHAELDDLSARRALG